ncbi:MAG: right-handed parallel beta-helix repeat-containing protein [Acidimicrobiia bacterium]|nr:right-handed parallel beta-helix repeat-containing protein [Acidimicrobiia bacterium]
MTVLVLAILMVCLGISVLFATGSWSPATGDTVEGELTPDDCDTDCGAVLRASIEALDAGETLQIAPGTYDIGKVSIDDVGGTAEEPIVVTASDLGERPQLVGHLLLTRPDHLRLDGLDLRADVQGDPALAVRCGVGWEVTRSDFSGASETKAFSNLLVSGTQPGAPNPDGNIACEDEPRDFLIAGNCLSDPYVDPDLDQHPDPRQRTQRNWYHNLYLSFEGSGRTSGTVERNIFTGNANGSGVKLGAGRDNPWGPDNVVVANNTFVSGRTGVVLTETVNDNTLVGNLFDDLEGEVAAGEGVAVFPHNLDGSGNEVSHSLAYDVGVIVAAPVEGDSVIDGVDNRVVDGDPDFVTRDDEPTSCRDFDPRDPRADAYGRYGSGEFEAP